MEISLAESSSMADAGHVPWMDVRRLLVFPVSLYMDLKYGVIMVSIISSLSGLPTVDLTVLASAAPNGVFLQLDTTIGGQPIEVGGVAIIMKLRRLISHYETSRH